jgi:carbon-monoxide dehydrogenase large subunit
MKPRNFHGIGARRPRIEDPPLLRGEGRYVDDISFPGQLHAAFVRSSYAHAVNLKIDAAEARRRPGIVALYTAADLAPHLAHMRLPIAFPAGQLPDEVMPLVLAADETLYVGEPLALVIATSRHLAEDAAEAVIVECDVADAIVDPRAALAASSPLASRMAKDNVFTRFRIAYGDEAAAFAKARHVFREQMIQHRGGAHPMEGRGIVARYEPTIGELTVWSSTQMSHELRHTLADLLLLSENQVRVVAPEVGGAFGAKYLVYPEEVAVAAASRVLGRPVKWIEDRREHFLAAIQERDQHWDIEIALDGGGHILGVRGTMIQDQGAYAPHSVNVPFNSVNALPGAYVVPTYALDVAVVRTNLVPVIPVRGAGYPQGCFALERLLDRAAHELGIDRAEIRRRNLVPADSMPYETPMKTRAGAPITYDSGDYLACQEKGLAAIDYEGHFARRDAARAAGRYLGIGFAHGVKGTGRGPFESGLVRVMPNGRISIYTGALAMGQGLKTALAQICADVFCMPLEQIDVTAGDTGYVALGFGGYASRQTVTAGSSVLLAAREVRAKALRVAAQMLEVAEQDLVLENGRISVNGAEEIGITLGKVASALRGLPGYAFPEGATAGLESEQHFRIDLLAYANGFHACEVEIDAETGAIEIHRYVAVQDSGTLINPLVAEGQIHGSIAHGIGNALYERMIYDGEGQPLTTTLADYLLVTAPEVPSIELHFKETPSPRNPLGVKGVGEAGIVPVTAAIASAVEDALSPFGVKITETPITPIRLLELIDAGRAS